MRAGWQVCFRKLLGYVSKVCGEWHSKLEDLKCDSDNWHITQGGFPISLHIAHLAITLVCVRYRLETSVYNKNLFTSDLLIADTFKNRFCKMV